MLLPQIVLRWAFYHRFPHHLRALVWLNGWNWFVLACSLSECSQRWSPAIQSSSELGSVRNHRDIKLQLSHPTFPFDIRARTYFFAEKVKAHQEMHLWSVKNSKKKSKNIRKRNANVSCGACRVSPHYSLADTVGEVLWCGTGSCDLSLKTKC